MVFILNFKQTARYPLPGIFLEVTPKFPPFFKLTWGHNFAIKKIAKKNSIKLRVKILSHTYI